MIPEPVWWLRSVRQLVADPLYRLRDFLENLTRRPYDRLAGAAGEVVAGLLRAVLKDSQREFRRRPPREPKWGSSGPGAYQAPPDYPASEARPLRQDVEEDTRQNEPEDVATVTTEEVPARICSRWRPTLAMALQLVSWWLRLPFDESPARAAPIDCIVAGLSTLAGVPPNSVAVLVGSAAGLIVLADVARDTVDARAEWAMP